MAAKGPKILRKCCCLTLKVGAFLVALCIMIGAVLSLFYSIYNIMTKGYGNAEKMMVYALEKDHQMEIYRVALRAQQSYERICTEGLDNFTAQSINDAWRNVSQRSLLRQHILSQRGKRSEDISSENILAKFIHGKGKPPEGKSPKNEHIRVNPETQKMPSQVDESKMKRQYRGKDLAELLQLYTNFPTAESEESGDTLGMALQIARDKRAYNHLTMEYTCVVNAENAKRLAAVYYMDRGLNKGEEFFRRAKHFYRNLDIFNAVISTIFIILATVLLWGVVLDNRWMILIWLATFPFYFIFSMIYMYLRFNMMLDMYYDFSYKGTIIFAAILFILIPIILFKYFVIFSYFWFIFTPAFWTMNSYNNMQMIVSRRGVDPNVNVNQENK